MKHLFYLMIFGSSLLSAEESAVPSPNMYYENTPVASQSCANGSCASTNNESSQSCANGSCGIKHEHVYIEPGILPNSCILNEERESVQFAAPFEEETPYPWAVRPFPD